MAGRAVDDVDATDVDATDGDTTDVDAGSACVDDGEVSDGLLGVGGSVAEPSTSPTATTRPTPTNVTAFAALPPRIGGI